ncbi:MAG: class I mannose-6-phosphate isomerase [Tannerellaceae bacterium]
MAKYLYDKTPWVEVEGMCVEGWNDVVATLNQAIDKKGDNRKIVVVECYPGVLHEELSGNLQRVNHDLFIDTRTLMLSEDEIRDLTWPDVTDDSIFGYLTRLRLEQYFSEDAIEQARAMIEACEGNVMIYGTGAALVCPKPDCLVYADMARWEIQARQRLGLVNGVGVKDNDEAPGIQYKRGYFVDWRVCDHQKKSLFEKADFWLDTNKANNPKMIAGSVHLQALRNAVKQPFRVVPFFDPGPWGGQWMKEVCDLDRSKKNFAWCFDCVPEENSLLIHVDGKIVEIPSINLVFYQSKELLGEPVESRFGQEFPIRFDFLDTMKGGNLSLQVHPTTQYIRDQFGMYYTQDESYYILDADRDATVYLGVKNGTNPAEMIAALEEAQKGEAPFDTDRFINQFPAKKHDHFLIPNGTIHCSGANSMVLEISATPYIFTFKLWDWNRLGLDGKPRPINIKHGANVIQWNRDTDYCQSQLVNQVTPIAQGEGWREERTGLHENEFIETRRHWFTDSVTHHTGGGVNVLNLVEGDEAIVESPTGAFDPFVVHYAETFIIPAQLGEYTIKPYGHSEGKECATIKAYVRFRD